MSIALAASGNLNAQQVTLAMATTYHLPQRVSQTVNASGQVITPTIASHKSEMLSEKEGFAIAAGSYMEKKVRASRDPLLIVHASLRAYDKPNAWVSVRAGYGQVWQNGLTLQKDLTNRNEPGIAYVKASFSF